MENTGKSTRSKSKSGPGQAVGPPAITREDPAITREDQSVPDPSGKRPTTQSDGDESLDLITQLPALSSEVTENIIKTATELPSQSEELSVEDRSHIWTKMKEAQSSGDAILAKILLTAYNNLDVVPTKDSPTMTRSVSALPVLSVADKETTIRNQTQPVEMELEDNLVYAVVGYFMGSHPTTSKILYFLYIQ
ncbi:hypothetical protein PGT21_036699 [Puccinia graminis f. sp. tritici]|uniref:Uncharacterized protein n=1 Tax=Puccinia graminis f. sp. tritici TaxID=56615 RepID=A0A5B0NRZ6_PUCGR|nr:hypothetical protein PGT21_036699 [Puccinia graminis f. sp. tritici]KAA1134409.1 hypothetical protein PGTUg99_001746 [Puccinia graminis f. sp. tritici]